MGYLQSFCWETRTHFQNCLSWFSGLKKSQSGEFRKQGQPYFHRLQQKEQNMHQSLEGISGHVPTPLGETPASFNMLGCTLRHKLRDYPDKKCLMNLVELAFSSDFLLPFCSHKGHTPSYRLFRSPSLPCLSCCPPSLITTDPAYTETRKARYQEALIHVCCLFLPLTSWITLNSRCLRGRTLRRVWAFLWYGWAITFTHLPSQCSYLANVDKQDGLSSLKGTDIPPVGPYGAWRQAWVDTCCWERAPGCSAQSRGSKKGHHPHWHKSIQFSLPLSLIAGPKSHLPWQRNGCLQLAWANSIQILFYILHY